MYAFLSEDWMNAARDIRARYRDQLPAFPAPIKINQVITDVPFGDGTVKAYLDTTSGALEFELGELDQPDAVMVTDYETARSMIVDRDPAIAMQAFLAGRIQVQGDMMKLMALQGGLPPSEASDQVAEELAAITD